MDDLARALRAEGADVAAAVGFALDMYEAAVRAHAYVGNARTPEREAIEDEYVTQRQLMERRLRQVLASPAGNGRVRAA